MVLAAHAPPCRSPRQLSQLTPVITARRREQSQRKRCLPVLVLRRRPLFGECFQLAGRYQHDVPVEVLRVILDRLNLGLFSECGRDYQEDRNALVGSIHVAIELCDAILQVE